MALSFLWGSPYRAYRALRGVLGRWPISFSVGAALRNSRSRSPGLASAGWALGSGFRLALLRISAGFRLDSRLGFGWIRLGLALAGFGLDFRSTSAWILHFRLLLLGFLNILASHRLSELSGRSLGGPRSVLGRSSEGPRRS